MTENRLSESARKVQQALDRLGLHLQVVELPASTRTAQDAANAIGCEVGQIAKSLVFVRKRSQEPVLIIASGKNRVNEEKMGEMLGEPLKKADADYVKNQTGFVIGGVPPVGHHQQLETYLDTDLQQYDVIWAAAGTPHAVFRLTPDELALATRAPWIEIK